MFNSGPDPEDPPKSAGTGGPGPPKNNPTVEPRMQNTKFGGSYTHRYGSITEMAQTGRQTHRYGICRMRPIPVGLVAAFWGAPCPKKQQLNLPVVRKSRESHIGGLSDRFEPYR